VNTREIRTSQCGHADTESTAGNGTSAARTVEIAATVAATGTTAYAALVKIERMLGPPWHLVDQSFRRDGRSVKAAKHPVASLRPSAELSRAAKGRFLNRGQRMGIAGQEPAAVGLFTVHRDSMTGELRRFPAYAWGHRQCVPAPRVRDFADDYDLFQLAAATDPNLLVGGREVGGESIPAERRLARIEEHDIVRHQREQEDQIAGIDGTDPGQMNLADFSFIRSHLLSPPVAEAPNALDQARPKAVACIRRLDASRLRDAPPPLGGVA